MVSGLVYEIKYLQCHAYTDWKRQTVDGNESVACHGKIHTDIFNMLETFKVRFEIVACS